MFKVLVAQHIHSDGLALLEQRPDIAVTVTEDISVANVSALAKDVDAITVRNGLVPAELIDGAHNLKILSRHGVGVDAIDLEAASRSGIPVATTITANSLSVTEQVFAFILGLAKQTKRYDQQMAQGNFGIRYAVETIDLPGRSLLVIGVGRIGRRVARLAQAFGLKVYGYDPYLTKGEITARDCIPVADWRSMLGIVDFVTLHCPKSPETVNMFGAGELEALGPKGNLINCARGGLVDEAALYEALSSGAIRGAALDVFATEPTTADNPLLALDRFIGSPHSAATTEEGLRRMGCETAQSVLDYIDGTLDPERVYNAARLADHGFDASGKRLAHG